MKIDKAVVQEYIDQKYITCKKHPDAELYIYNYTKKAQIDKKWDEITMMCRGLITDQEGTILYRPFKKFFNLEEHRMNLQKLPDCGFVIHEKMDGSLGILYKVNGTYAIATRGSFTSDQALHATKVLQKIIKTFGDKIEFSDKLTYLFEIIYPENRIVVDYGERDQLVCLAIIDTETGQEAPPEEMKLWFPVAERIRELPDFETLQNGHCRNREGYVMRFHNGLRLKIKFQDYVRLHRLYTGLTKRKIWEAMKNKEDIDGMIAKTEEEFSAFVRFTIHEIDTTKRLALTHAKKVVAHVRKNMKGADRTAIAEYIKQQEHAPLCFFVFDKKKSFIDKYIWNLSYPDAEKPFHNDIDI